MSKPAACVNAALACLIGATSALLSVCNETSLCERCCVVPQAVRSRHTGQVLRAAASLSLGQSLPAHPALNRACAAASKHQVTRQAAAAGTGASLPLRQGSRQ